MRNVILKIIGYSCLVVGGIGIFVPILPTTPFVLISAGCFATCDARVYQKLLKTKYFGEYIDNYKNKGGVSILTKIYSLIFMWVLLSISIYFVSILAVQIIIALIGCAVTLHILLLRKKR